MAAKFELKKSKNDKFVFNLLASNGQVILSNPQGVYFGPSARVDVGGLVASSRGYCCCSHALTGAIRAV